MTSKNAHVCKDCKRRFRSGHSLGAHVTNTHRIRGSSRESYEGRKVLPVRRSVLKTGVDCVKTAIAVCSGIGFLSGLSVAIMVESFYKGFPAGGVLTNGYLFGLAMIMLGIFWKKIKAADRFLNLLEEDGRSKVKERRNKV